MRALLIAVTVLSLSRLMAQSSDPPPAEAPASENWNLYYQATSIGQNHGTFNSPYTGPLSLQDYREDDVSLTTTLFFDVRLAHNLQFVFDPEDRRRLWLTASMAWPTLPTASCRAWLPPHPSHTLRGYI